MANKKRISTKVEPIESREAMDAAVGKIVQLNADLDTNLSLMEADLARIRESYAPVQGELARERDELVARALAWAKENPHQFPGDSRSIKFVQGVVGFRIGNWELKPLNGKNWDDVVELLEKRRSRFLDWEPKVLKNELLAKRDRLGESGLAKLFMRVTRTERFFVEAHDSAPVPEVKLAAGGKGGA